MDQADRRVYAENCVITGDKNDVADSVDALTKKNTIKGKAARLSNSLDDPCRPSRGNACETL